MAAAIGLVVLSAGAARADREDFVGTRACGGCHPSALRVWQASAHARASETLGAKVRDRRCLTCHATGDAPGGRAYGDGVGCESCHGAGAGYSPDDVMRSPALARALGLRDLTSPAARDALCVSCHRASTRIEPFDSARAWKTIAH